MSGAEFQYSELIGRVFCGQMANLVAESGGNKGQLSLLVEAICRDFRWKHDFQWAEIRLPMGGNWASNGWKALINHPQPSFLRRGV